MAAYLTRALRGRVKDPGLHFTGQRAVDGEDNEFGYLTAQSFHSLIQDLTGCVNLLLTRQEQQYITC